MPLDPNDVKQAYEQHRDALRAFLRTHAHRKDGVDDLVQEVYVTLMRFPPKEPLRDPSAYLYKVAWHTVQRFNKRERREPQAYDPETLEQLYRETHADASEELAAEQHLEQLLRELPPAYGAVLILNRRDGLSYAEIASQLNLSISQVRRYLGLALVHLKKANWSH